MSISAVKLKHWFVRCIGSNEDLLSIEDIYLAKDGRLLLIVTDKGLLPINDEMVIADGSIITNQPPSTLIIENDDNFLRQQLSVNNLLGRNVFDAHQHLLGVLGDLIFDEKTKFLSRLELSQGFFADLIDGREDVKANKIISQASGITYS